jgi:hypothetical protein
MTPASETTLKNTSLSISSSPSMKTPKKIVIIGDKFLETLVKVSDTYFTTHNKIDVLSTDCKVLQNKLYLLP